MKKISILSLMLMSAFAVSNANAAITYTLTDGTNAGHKAQAKIQQSVKATDGTALNFGTNTVTIGQGGTVVVAPGASGATGLTVDDSVINTGSNVTGGTITVWGPENTQISIGTGTVSNGSVTMPISAPLLQIGSGSASNSVLIGSGDSAAQSSSGLTVNTGGTLTISANQASGDYVGYLPVTLTYPGTAQ